SNRSGYSERRNLKAFSVVSPKKCMIELYIFQRMWLVSEPIELENSPLACYGVILFLGFF
ncbi:MAG: hypothetical protein KC588_19655, partial [Nitrospira sp.]|nr:hypothetical protein [Nitrospira sp.]